MGRLRVGNPDRSNAGANRVRVLPPPQSILDAVVPAAGVIDFLTDPSSANLEAALTDKTGTGAVVLDSALAIDGRAWSGRLAGSGITNAQQLADWIDANL